MENKIESIAGFRDTYRIVRFLTSGGMGDILEAVDSQGRNVVVKIPKNFAPNRDDPLNDQVINESENLKRLIHPNIVRYMDSGEYKLKPFLVMEKVEGISLKQYVEERDYGYEFAVSLASKMLSALKYLRKYRIVHRDLSSTNIIIEPDGSPKIIDFSTSIRMSSDTDMIRIKGSKIGTEGYSAPEQLKEGISYIDSDVYSLGALSFFALTSRKPEKIKKDVKSIERFNGLPLYEIITKCLVEKRDDRETDLEKIEKIIKA